MQNMEQDPIQKLIQDAAEPLAPTEAAKDRMYAEIMRRAAEKQASRHQKRRPWYQRWQTSAGAVALACVVLAFSALHGRLPQNGAGQLEVVPEQTTVTKAVGIMETETKTQPQESASSVPQKETTAVSETAAVSKETQTTAASAVTEVPSLPEEEPEESWRETQPAVVPTAPETVQTQPAVTRPASAATTAALVSQTTAAPETRQPETQTTAAATTTAPSFTHRPLPSPTMENIRYYYRLMWDGMPYDTEYEIISSEQIVSYLGVGVTSGPDVGDTFTVLVYEIESEGETAQLAVQYAGMDEYYLFTAMQ